jgi:hypothetical protein
MSPILALKARFVLLFQVVKEHGAQWRLERGKPVAQFANKIKKH